MASNSINELAMLFKERDNKKSLGTLVGTVVSVSPISVMIGNITVSGGKLIVSNTLVDRKETVFINDVETIIEYKKVLKVGDRVIVNTTSDKQTFIVTEKVGGN